MIKEWRASPHFVELIFEYRFVAESVATDWRVEPNVWKSALSRTATFAQGEWIPAGGTPEGKYELRIISQCKAAPGPEEFESSSTTVIQGIVDEIQPEIVTVTTSAGLKGFSADDLVTVTFTESIFCAGINPQTKGNVAVTLALTVRGAEFKGGKIRWECHRNVIQISLDPVGRAEFAQTRKGASGDQLQVEVTGVIDQAGNVLFDPAAGGRRERRSSAIAGPAVTLVAQKCAAAQFVGDLVDDDGFVVTGSSSQITFTVMNPSGQTFGDDGASSVTFSFRQETTRSWSVPVPISDGAAGVDATQITYTREFGDATAHPSGAYRVRVKAVCGAAFVPSPADVMMGLVDRAAPRALAASRPVTAGISVGFNEPIACTSATSATVKLGTTGEVQKTIESSSSTSPMVLISCDRSTISLEIKGLSSDDLAKKLTGIVVENVADTAGNVATKLTLEAAMFEADVKAAVDAQGTKIDVVKGTVESISDNQSCQLSLIHI